MESDYFLPIFGLGTVLLAIGWLVGVAPSTGVESGDRWVYRMPLRSQLRRAFCAAALGVFGLAFIVVVNDLGYLPGRRDGEMHWSFGYLAGVPLVGWAVYIVTGLIVGLLRGPAHSPMAISSDDRVISVYEGLLPRRDIPWDQVTNVSTHVDEPRRGRYRHRGLVIEYDGRRFKRLEFSMGGDATAVAAALARRDPAWGAEREG